MSEESPANAPAEQVAGFWRRTGAMVYDGLLLVAIWFTITGLAVSVNAGRAVEGPGLQMLLAATAFLFFGWFWTHHGRTLGMQAWRLRVRGRNGMQLTWRDAGVRFLAACVTLPLFGVGHLWMLFDAQSRSLPDIWSRSRVTYLPKPQPPAT